MSFLSYPCITTTKNTSHFVFVKILRFSLTKNELPDFSMTLKHVTFPDYGNLVISFHRTFWTWHPCQSQMTQWLRRASQGHEIYSGGHKFEPRSGWTCGAQFFCPSCTRNPKIRIHMVQEWFLHYQFIMFSELATCIVICPRFIDLTLQ